MLNHQKTASKTHEGMLRHLPLTALALDPHSTISLPPKHVEQIAQDLLVYGLGTAIQVTPEVDANQRPTGRHFVLNDGQILLGLQWLVRKGMVFPDLPVAVC